MAENKNSIMTQNNSTKLSFPVNISTGKSLVHYLKTANNEYTQFILLKIAEEPHLYNTKTRRKGYELHHILPTHANGPDIPENFICLSFEDHAKAHLILYEVYGSYYDLCAYKMLKGKTIEGAEALRQANIEKNRKEKKGRFNSVTQAECGRKNKGVVKKPHAKLLTVAAALQHGMLWQHEDGTIVEISPGQCKGMTDVVNLLIFGLPLDIRQDYLKKKSKHPFYCRVNRLISGNRGYKTNKTFFGAGPWRLLGVFI